MVHQHLPLFLVDIVRRILGQVCLIYDSVSCWQQLLVSLSQPLLVGSTSTVEGLERAVSAGACLVVHLTETLHEALP